MRRIYCKTTTCRKWANINDDGLCPNCVSDTNNDSLIPDCICSICKEEVLDNETKALGCDLCKNWFHPKCVGNNAILDLLDAVAQIGSEEKTFVGCLLWLCPECSSMSKPIKLNNGSCELVADPPKASTKEKGLICKNYRLGACNEGENCKYNHPAKCLNYCRFGRDGCSGGFQSCQLLHPVLCRDSLNYRKCYNESCTLAHLKGTDRNPHNEYPRNLNEHSQTHKPPNMNFKGKRHHYSTYNRDNLGFRSYQPPRQRKFVSHTNKTERDDPFVYNDKDFPDALGNHQPFQNQDQRVNRNQSLEPLFLDLLKSIQCIQHNQQNFQQDLMSIKRFLPPLPVNQSQNPQGSYPLPPHQQQHFFQPQTSAEM